MGTWEAVGILFICISAFVIAVNTLQFNFVGICVGAFSLCMWVMVFNQDRKKKRLAKALAKKYTKKDVEVA
jgi:Flp pilus assembly protein TadB